MLSEKDDVETIALWLLEWQQSGAISPKEVVVDCSLVLSNAILLAFNLFPFCQHIDACYRVMLQIGSI